MKPVLFLVCFVVACAPAYKPVRRAVRVADLQVFDRSKLTSRFVWDDGDFEFTVPGQSPEVVTDAAFLGDGGGRLCAYLQMRTGAKHDAPFGEWQPTINGEPVFPEQEKVSEQVFAVAGERDVVSASFLSNTALGDFAVKEATTDEYKVVTREAWFCPTAAPAGQVELKLQRDFGSSKLTEGFIWTIVP